MRGSEPPISTPRRQSMLIACDPPHGEAVLRELSGGDLPPTAEMVTGKGRRLLYAIPDGLEVEPRTVVVEGPDGTEGVRLQGGATGAQCVMPPSAHHSGNAYRWADDRQDEENNLGIFASTPFPIFPQYRAKPGRSQSWNLINVFSPTMTNEAIFTYNDLDQIVDVEHWLAKELAGALLFEREQAALNRAD